MNWFLRWGNWAVAKLIEILYNTPYLSDVGCTYRLLSRECVSASRPSSAHRAAVSVSRCNCWWWPPVSDSCRYRSTITPRRRISRYRRPAQSTRVGLDMIGARRADPRAARAIAVGTSMSDPGYYAGAHRGPPSPAVLAPRLHVSAALDQPDSRRARARRGILRLLQHHFGRFTHGDRHRAHRRRVGRRRRCGGGRFVYRSLAVSRPRRSTSLRVEPLSNTSTAVPYSRPSARFGAAAGRGP